MRIRTGVVGAVALITVYLVNSYALASPASSQHETSDRFWALTKLRGDEVESFASLDAITKSADVVVVGHITGTGASRSFRAMEADSEVDTAWYAYVEIAPDWSSPAIDQMRFEVFFPTKAYYETFLAAEIPGDSAVYFLRNKEQAALAAGWPTKEAATEHQYSMLANQDQALLRNIDGAVHVVDPASGDFTTALEGTSFLDLLDRVKAIRQGSE